VLSPVQLKFGELLAWNFIQLNMFFIKEYGIVSGNRGEIFKQEILDPRGTVNDYEAQDFTQKYTKIPWLIVWNPSLHAELIFLQHQLLSLKIQIFYKNQLVKIIKNNSGLYIF
jgi:hypothetical protein